MGTRINLSSLLHQLNDLQKEIILPKFSSIVITPEYFILQWDEIPRKWWGSLPYKIPLITNTRIEYKSMSVSKWNIINTSSDTTTACCFYMKNKIHDFSKSHQHFGYLWNEYNACHVDDFYDIRIRYENYSDNKHWTTISSIGIPTLPPVSSIYGLLTEHIEHPVLNQPYLVLNAIDIRWQQYENHIAVFNSSRVIHGWVIYYPRKGWKINNLYFDGKRWIDIKLHTIIKLLDKKTPRDLMFHIIEYSWDSVLPKSIIEDYYNHFIGV